ncbi:hypothetical protein [Prevotella sp. P2-180]|nr:hypothetical protein [Prevotella sp. P2-180]
MARRRFSRAFKRAVAVEYVKSGVKRQEIAMKYRTGDGSLSRMNSQKK